MNALKALLNDLPSEYSTRLGNEYIKSQSLDHKKAYAQYFTPINVAHFMASLVNCRKSIVKVADLGAGSGVLGISICEALVKKNKNLKKIELTVYEIDNEILPVLEQCLEYTKQWLAKKKIGLVLTIKKKILFLKMHRFYRKNYHLSLP